MKKIILWLFVTGCFCVGGMAHAQDWQAEIPIVSYPPVVSPALNELPGNAITIVCPFDTFYYAKGIFYQKIVLDNKYVAVPPPIGAVIYEMPVGYEYIIVDGQIFYIYKNVYYRRVLDGYQVVPPVVV